MSTDSQATKRVETLNVTPEQHSRITQGERIGKIEVTMARWSGMALLIGTLFTMFGAGVFAVFFSSYGTIVGLGKDIKTINDYMQESKQNIQDLKRSIDGLSLRVNSLESWTITHDRIEASKRNP